MASFTMDEDDAAIYDTIHAALSAALAVDPDGNDEQQMHNEVPVEGFVSVNTASQSITGLPSNLAETSESNNNTESQESHPSKPDPNLDFDLDDIDKILEETPFLVLPGEMTVNSKIDEATGKSYMYLTSAPVDKYMALDINDGNEFAAGGDKEYLIEYVRTHLEDGERYHVVVIPEKNIQKAEVPRWQIENWLGNSVWQQEGLHTNGGGGGGDENQGEETAVVEQEDGGGGQAQSCEPLSPGVFLPHEIMNEILAQDDVSVPGQTRLATARDLIPFLEEQGVSFSEEILGVEMDGKSGSEQDDTSIVEQKVASMSEQEDMSVTELEHSSESGLEDVSMLDNEDVEHQKDSGHHNGQHIQSVETSPTQKMPREISANELELFQGFLGFSLAHLQKQLYAGQPPQFAMNEDTLVHQFRRHQEHCEQGITPADECRWCTSDTDKSHYQSINLDGAHSVDGHGLQLFESGNACSTISITPPSSPCLHVRWTEAQFTDFIKDATKSFFARLRGDAEPSASGSEKGRKCEERLGSID